MKQRSPLLGYNHNIRHGGRLYHVQTEDSGAANPHISTHLFHAGTILSSKRTDYPATEEERAVQRLMQVQHRLMLRELRDGLYDARISQSIGSSSPSVAPAPRPADLAMGRAPAARISGNDFAIDVVTPPGIAPRDATVSDASSEPTTLSARASEPQPGDGVRDQALADELELPDDVTPLPEPIPAARAGYEPDTVPIVPDEPEPLPGDTAAGGQPISLDALDADEPPTPVRRTETPARGTRFTPSRPLPALVALSDAPHPLMVARPHAADPQRLRARSPDERATVEGAPRAPLPPGSSIELAELAELADPPHLHLTPARLHAVPAGPAPGIGVTRSIIVGVRGGRAGATRGSPVASQIPVPPPPLAAAAPGSPHQPPSDSNIFGEVPPGDRSLDDVILAYLADDGTS